MALWVGFDFDGTLVEMPLAGQAYGADVPEMVQMLATVLAAGIEVRIMTARAVPECVWAVKGWLKDHGWEGLAITDRKDFEMAMLFDDRCITVRDGRIRTDGPTVNRILEIIGARLP